MVCGLLLPDMTRVRVEAAIAGKSGFGDESTLDLSRWVKALRRK
jgi:hypothetical protein